MPTDDDLEALVWSSPVRRTEGDWLAAAGYLLRRLAAVTPGDIRLGPYWISNRYDHDGSWCSRIACASPLPFVQSDGWEASFCVSGNREGSWADIDIFPFRGRQKVGEVGRFWGFHYNATAGWRSRGWMYSDGCGDWDYVTGPGKCYFAAAAIDIVRQPRRDRPPILGFRSVTRKGRDLPPGPSAVAVSLSHVERDGVPLTVGIDEPRLLATGEIPSLRVPVRPADNRGGEFAIESLTPPGVWRPGDYRVVVRVRRPVELGWGDGPDADVSPPIRFRIGGQRA